MTGIFKDIVQSIKDEPWIPSEAGVKNASAGTAAKNAGASFCDGSSSRPCVTVCAPKGGCGCDCGKVRDALVQELARRKLDIKVGDAKVGCSGSCKVGPLVGFPQRGFFYTNVSADKVPEIVEQTIVNGKVIAGLLSVNPDRSYRRDFYFEKESGLLATIDDSVSMIEVAKYFLEFEKGLSCGKCIPCRIGLQRMLEALQRVVSGEGTTLDLDEIETLCEMMIAAPYCEFAATSSMPVYSALKFFRDEFNAVVKFVERPAPEPVVKKERPPKVVKPVEVPETSVPVEEAPAEAKVEVPVAAEVPVAEEQKVEAPVAETEPEVTATVSAPEEPVAEKTEEIEPVQTEAVETSVEGAPAILDQPAESVEVGATESVAAEEAPAEVVTPEVENEPEPVEPAAEITAEAPVAEPAVEAETPAEVVTEPSEASAPAEIEVPQPAQVEKTVATPKGKVQKGAKAPKAKKEKAPAKKKKSGGSSKSSKK